MVVNGLGGWPLQAPFAGQGHLDAAHAGAVALVGNVGGIQELVERARDVGQRVFGQLGEVGA